MRLLDFFLCQERIASGELTDCQIRVAFMDDIEISIGEAEDLAIELDQEADRLCDRIKAQLDKDRRPIVKSLKPIEVPVPWLGPNEFKKSPVISAEDSPLIRLPELPEIPEWVRKEAGKIPSEMGELAITAVGGEDYLKVLKIGVHLKDEAIRQMDKFMDLAWRGFPEEEASAFESEQLRHPHEIAVEDLTDFPATAYREYGAAEENKAQSWFWKPLF